MTSLLLSFGAAFLLSLFLTYNVRGWAARVGLVDVPADGRRVHDRPIPYGGGIAIYTTVALVVGVAWLLGTAPFGGDAAGVVDALAGAAGAGGAGALGGAADAARAAGAGAAGRALPFALMLGGAAMFLIGLWDDARPLPAWLKFVGQCAVAVAVFAAGIRIDTLSVVGGAPLPGWVSLVVTVLWLVGITNAFNLIDGSDGVAAGSAIFAALAVAAVLLIGTDSTGALIALTLAGATLGFLFFNFPPASIFLGDSGSLFLGFMLGALGVVTSQKAPTALAVAIPVVSFGLPILDTGLAILRRSLRGEPIFKADRGHVHHRLRDLGHSPRRIALLLYAASAAFALLSILLSRPSGATQAIAFAVTGLVVWIVVQRLDIPELVEVRRIVGRGLMQRRAIANNVRIRESIGALRRAEAPADVLAALEHAVSGGEFTRAELRLPARVGAGLAPSGGVQRQRAGCVWRWGAEADGLEPGLWEIRLPLRTPKGRTIGRLSLWQPVEGRHLLADVRLLATELEPELYHALRRLTRRRGAVARARARGGAIGAVNGAAVAAHGAAVAAHGAAVAANGAAVAAGGAAGGHVNGGAAAGNGAEPGAVHAARVAVTAGPSAVDEAVAAVSGANRAAAAAASERRLAAG